MMLFWNMVKINKLVIDEKINNDPIESRYYMTCYLLLRVMREHNITHILTFNNTNANVKNLQNKM